MQPQQPQPQPQPQPQQPGQPQVMPTNPNEMITVTSQATPDIPISTQTTIPISEIRDGIVIMKDGSFRAVIACKPINFDLMSEQERESVEYTFQGFLNSLTFTTQILVRSQRIDIGPYIEKLIKINGRLYQLHRHPLSRSQHYG